MALATQEWADDPAARAELSEKLVKKMVVAAPAALAKFKTFGGGFKPVVREYVVDPYFPRGKNVLFDARGGVGKSSLLLAFAAMLGNGTAPFTYLKQDPVTTLYMIGDSDDAEDYETVYRACGGKPGMITYVERSDMPRLDDKGMDEVVTWIESGGFGLVVFDPFFKLLQGVLRDTKDDIEARVITERFDEAAKATNACFVDVRHLTKGAPGQSIETMGSGSQQYVDCFRGQLTAEQSKKDRSVVIVRDLKGSILVPKGPPFAYRRVGTEVQFVENFTDPDEREDYEESSTDGRLKRDQCIEAVCNYLKDGPRLTSDLNRVCSIAGFTPKTLRNSKERMRIETFQDHQGHWARLPRDFDLYAVL